MTRDAKAGVGRSASGRKSGPSDVSDVDVLLSLSRIIGYYPASLTRVDVKRKKIVSARDIYVRTMNKGRLYVSRRSQILMINIRDKRERE